MPVVIPDSLVHKLAMQHYTDVNRPTFDNAPREWRPDVEEWFALPQTVKELWYAGLRKWLEYWEAKYPGSLDYVLQNWIDLDFQLEP